MLTVLGDLAEFERALIMERTQAGIAHAREHGVALERPPRLNPRQKRMIAERYASGETFPAGAGVSPRRCLRLAISPHARPSTNETLRAPTLSLPSVSAGWSAPPFRKRSFHQFM